MGVSPLPYTVGYAQSGLKNGGTMTAAQFVNIGADTAMPLESISLTGEDVSDSVSIMTLDAFGRTVDTYDWNDWAQDEPCWVDGDFEKVEGVTFDAGQGLWVIGASTAQGITFPAPEL